MKRLKLQSTDRFAHRFPCETFVTTRLSSATRWFVITAAAFVCLQVAPATAATRSAANCSQAAVQSAISSAAAGDVVAVPAGRCTWGSSIVLPNNKKITLRGAGKTATIITGAIDFARSGSRVTGFTFTGNRTIYSDGFGFRMDNSRIQRSAWGDAFNVGARQQNPPQVAYGLIDNNEIINGRVNAEGTRWMLNEGNAQHQLWTSAISLGGPNSVYVEDNTFTNTLGPSACNFVDGNYGGSYVVRYNTMNGCIIEAHSSQEQGNRAIRSWEIYGNIINNTYANIYYPFRIRGGTGMVFLNSVPGNWAYDGVAFDNVRSYASAGLGAGRCNGGSAWDGNQDSTGYPCRDQIGRARDTTRWSHVSPIPRHSQALVPAYVWLNRTESNKELAVSVISNSGNHIKPNRDFYAHTPTFNGTTGVGCGALASRPTTCRVGTGYWATSQSCTSVSGRVGARAASRIAGTLYRCTAPNTWTAYYTPYAYPHPARR
jgi:hypothetical protein